NQQRTWLSQDRRWIDAAPCKLFNLLQLEYAAPVEDAVQIGVQAGADCQSIRPAETGLSENAYTLDNIRECPPHAVPGAHRPCLATVNCAQTRQAERWFAIENEAIFRVRCRRRGGGYLANVKRHAQLAAGFEVAPM